MYFAFRQPTVDRFKTQRKNTRRKKRVIRALRYCGQGEYADRIENCNKYSRCSSNWCPKCSKESKEHLSERIFDHINRAYGSNEEAIRAQLLFVTPLYGLAAVHDLYRVQKIVREARSDWKALRRRFPELWWQGAFEFELIDIQGVLATPRQGR